VRYETREEDDFRLISRKGAGERDLSKVYIGGLAAPRPCAPETPDAARPRLPLPLSRLVIPYPISWAKLRPVRVIAVSGLWYERSGYLPVS
jgi:hypothetical protein